MHQEPHMSPEQPPLQELEVPLRQAVEQVRNQPVPMEPLRRALDRAGKMSEPRSRTWWQRRPVVALAGVAAALLVAIVLWQLFGPSSADDLHTYAYLKGKVDVENSRGAPKALSEEKIQLQARQVGSQEQTKQASEDQVHERMTGVQPFSGGVEVHEPFPRAVPADKPALTQKLPSFQLEWSGKDDKEGEKRAGEEKSSVPTRINDLPVFQGKESDKLRRDAAFGLGRSFQDPERVNESDKLGGDRGRRRGEK